MDVYVARQPIFNRRQKIVGYELLFRDGTAAFVPDMDGDVATNTVLSNSMFSIGLESLLGGKKAFVNFTQNLLTQKVPLLLPKETVVVEILEDVVPTTELLDACREMVEKGYTLALDDFTYSDDLKSLIALAHIIKFDFRLTPLDDIQSYLSKIERRNGLELLAEKVETYDEFNIAVDMGFEYFQGYFFCKPELVKGKKISGSQLSLLRIIAEVNKVDFQFDTIENLIAPDVSLSYKLLRYINSAFFAKANPIDSIKQALVYLGESEIRRFVSLVGMADLASGKPDELVRTACIRGKFCELMASISPLDLSASELFTLGTFSLIDAIVDQPMHSVMEELPLSRRIKSALTQRKGSLTAYLVLAETYEKGDWNHVQQLTVLMDLPQSQLPELYHQACQWSNTLLDAKQADDADA
jgi:EAL and modified HD-GYP domain-containing signal transduction protein